MRKYFFTTLCLLLFSFPVYASYEREAVPCCRPIPKWYVGLRGSIALLTDVHYDSNTSLNSNDLEFDPGYGGSGNFGYLIHPDFAIELEVGYYKHELAKVDGQSYVPSTGSYSAQTSTALMANAIYTYHTRSLFSPYIGAGAGMVYVVTPYNFTYIPTGESHRARDWVPGYQFMAGVSYDVPASPIEVVLGYRYLTAEKGEIKFNSASPLISVSFGNDVHIVELGGKLHF